MNTVFYLLAFIIGCFSGWIFFKSLYWTIQKGLTSKRPWLVFFLSYFLRMSGVLSVFYFVGQGSVLRLVFCLVGFVFAKFYMKKLVVHAS